MADVHNQLQHEPHKGKNTKPEMLARCLLHANGFRYKLYDKTLLGKPDIALPKYKTVILYMVASGIAIKIVNILLYLKPERNGC